jgi:nitrogen fixation protein FixH
MHNYNLVLTLGLGSLLAFSLFFIFYKIIHWSGKMSALATAALMLLIYMPLAITHWDGIDVFAIHFAFFMMIPYGLGIITAVHAERRDLEGNDTLKKGMHWIPGMIIVFFIILATVDSFIISSATSGLEGGLTKLLLPKPASHEISQNISSNFTGAVSNNLQDEEKQFDNYVIKLKKQRQRAWKIGGGWLKPYPLINQDVVFRITANDKYGNPITGANVTTEFRRASDRTVDKLYTLKEAESSGVYTSDVNLPLAGCWSMKVLVIKGDDEHEIKGETEISTMVDGKLHTPECIDGEPDVDEKRAR